jgi:hypothetical protein
MAVASKKTYETQFLLGAKVQSSMGAAFGMVSGRMSKMQREAVKSQKTFGCLTGAIHRMYGEAAAFFSMRAIINYSKAASEAAQAQIDAETKLNVIMKQRMKATDGQVKSVLNLTAAQQKLGVIGDEVQLAGAQQLGTFVTQTKSLKILIPAMNNLLAQQKGLKGTQQDSVNIGNMMGKVFTGQVGALTRVGISFSNAQGKVLKYGTEQQKAAMLAKVITQNVGQMNAALAKTDQGKLQQANNNLGDMKEKIGKKIIPLQVKFAEMFLKAVPYIQKMLPLLDKIPPLVDRAASGAQWVVKNWSKIKPVIVALTAAFVVYNAVLGINKLVLIAAKLAQFKLVVAQKAGLIISKLSSAWGTATAALALLREGNSLAAVAQLVFNGTLLACPVTWFVTGIAAIAAGAFLLVKNWGKVKSFFSGLWNWLKKSWKDIMLVVFLPFIGIPMLIIKNWSKIKGFFGGNKKGKTTKTPKYATGTANHPGGWAMVGERGPELLNLPRGSQVTPNSRTESLLNGLSRANIAGAINLTIHQNFYGQTDKEEVKKANKESMAEFERKFSALINRRQRLSFV